RIARPSSVIAYTSALRLLFAVAFSFAASSRAPASVSNSEVCGLLFFRMGAVNFLQAGMSARSATSAGWGFLVVILQVSFFRRPRGIARRSDRLTPAPFGEPGRLEVLQGGSVELCGSFGFAMQTRHRFFDFLSAERCLQSCEHLLQLLDARADDLGL